jgi:acyl-coenzyme A synthetase/AMP-(fatty) acid ligase
MLFSILLPLAAGARFVRETPLLTPVIEDSARRYQANVLVSVPAHLRVLSESQLTSLASVRRIFSSGAPLADATAHELHRRFQVGVYEILGSTETGGFAHRRADADGARFRPFAGVTITSDDEQALCLRSPLLDPSVPQPLVCPDRIELNADGSFRHLGRIDGVVKVGGTRVSLAELETRVRALDGVLDVAALAVDGTRARGQEIWLVIASERGQELPELRAHLLRYYEPVLLPRRVRFIDALPREATGKLMRARLLELFRSSKSESTVP